MIFPNGFFFSHDISSYPRYFLSISLSIPIIDFNFLAIYLGVQAVAVTNGFFTVLEPEKLGYMTPLTMFIEKIWNRTAGDFPNGSRQPKRSVLDLWDRGRAKFFEGRPKELGRPVFDEKFCGVWRHVFRDVSGHK